MDADRKEDILPVDCAIVGKLLVGTVVTGEKVWAHAGASELQKAAVALGAATRGGSLPRDKLDDREIRPSAEPPW